VDLIVHDAPLGAGTNSTATFMNGTVSGRRRSVKPLLGARAAVLDEAGAGRGGNQRWHWRARQGPGSTLTSLELSVQCQSPLARALGRDRTDQSMPRPIAVGASPGGCGLASTRDGSPSSVAGSAMCGRRGGGSE